MEPIIFYLAAPEVVQYSVKLPSGKIVLLKRGEDYKTEDAEEIEFLSKQRYFGARKLDDKEFRIWATLRYKNVPTVDKVIEDKSYVEAMVWNSETEEYAVNKLKENGYTVYKKSKGK